MTDLHDAPPTATNLDPDAHLNFEEPAGWPKTIGIISILIAGFGIVCGGLTTAMMFALPAIMQSAESSMEGGVPPVMLQSNLLLSGLMVVGVLWAVVLLIAAIMLLTRNPTARLVYLVYAPVAIVLTLVTFYFSFEQQAQINEWVAQNPNAQFSQSQSSLGQYISLFFGIALGIAWPVFVLIWFGAIKRDASEINRGVPDVVA